MCYEIFIQRVGLVLNADWLKPHSGRCLFHELPPAKSMMLKFLFTLDIGFHFSPRFDNWDKVVFNSCQEGEWGSEEEIHNMPFSKGDAFEMVIIINQEGYQVRYILYRYRYSNRHCIDIDTV
uniref:Galectin n=1 Tax=Hucho hucho TaxID=62062 RepID=A0A4W5KL37_9TELE